MKLRRETFKEASLALAAGPEASDPRVTAAGALIALPAPPRPVVMYCCLGVTVGCGSTMLYLDETDMVILGGEVSEVR